MKLLLLCLLGLNAFACSAIVPRPKDGAEEEDTYMEPLDILKKYGYPAEGHVVQTDDGYILTLHRIPYGRKCSADKSRGPVLVQHGLLSSSVDWFITGTEKGLPYILADNCYDVWLGNSRGNTYSKAHTSHPVDSDAFWDFSWHEMGKYDLPAVIDYILHTTGSKDLHYIGHSQGTTQFFVYNSLYPEYKDKVKAAHLLAPIAFLEHSNSLLLDEIAKFSGVLGWIADVIGMNEFLPQNDLITNIGGKLCAAAHPDLEAMCENFAFIICGFDSDLFNHTMIPIFLGHFPGGAATKQLLHYAQSFNKGYFRQYDYGKSKNKEIYGTPEPPDYDLSKINVPIFLHYSKNDFFAAVEDVEHLATGLGDALEEKILIPYDKFNHLDYIIATEAPSLVYDKVIDLMNRY